MKRKMTMMSLVLVLLVAAGCGAKSPGPESPTATDAPPTATEAPPTPAPVTTPTSAGTVYRVNPDRSEASYAVRERFFGKESDVTAIGRTSAFTGELILNGGIVQPSTIQIDLSTLTSDEARRDNQVRRALDTGTHKLATFAIAQSGDYPALQEGQETSFTLQGQMTIKGAARPLSFAAKAKLEGTTVTLNAETTFAMTDFGVTPPSIGGFVSVTDQVTLHVTYVGTKE